MAGFPSPAEVYIESRLDLNECELLARPGPQPGHVVVAVMDGEFLVKRLIRQADRWLLACENPDYPATIPLDDAQGVSI